MTSASTGPVGSPFETLAGALIDALPVAVYVCDSDARIVGFNQRAVELWGRAPTPDERFCGSLMMIRADGSVLPHDECPMADVLRTGETARGIEVVIQRPDDSRVTVVVTIVPFADATGRVTGAVNTFQESREVKRSTEEISRREHELEDFVENATEGLHWVGPDGVILWANQAELDLLGYTRDEYVGHHIAEFHADRAVIDDILARLWRNENLKAYESRLRCKDGSIRHVLLNSSVLWRDGEFIHTRCFTRDITDQKRTEDLQAQLAAIVDSSDDVVISKTLAGIITSWNRAAEKMFGYTAAEAVGQHITLIVPDERRAEEEDVLASLRRGERVDHFETVRQAKDGHTVDISLTVSPVRNPRGEIIGASKVAREITTQKRLKALLEEAVQAREEFLSIASHELRNPVGALQLQLVALLRAMQKNEGAVPREWASDRIGHAVAAAHRLVQLVETLLDVSRINSGRLHLEPEEMDFGQSIRAVVDRFKGRLTEHQISLRVSSTTGRWDRLRLEQIVTNLRSNAIKYGEGHPIEISLEGDARTVYLSVQDHGIGIEPEHQQRLFERFERVISRRHYSGFGLGLWITRQVVEAMGGGLSVESEAGEGSTFRVMLPRFQPPAAGATGASVI